MAWLTAGLIALLVLVAGGVVWWRGRAVTADAIERALDKQPQTFAEMTARLGWFAQTDYYATMPQDNPLLVSGFCDHPDLSRRVQWYEGRGGRPAVVQVQFIDGLLNAWQHQQVVSSAQDMEGLPLRSYCVYLNAAGNIVGWADVTGGPGIFDLVAWAKASRPGEHPDAKAPE